MKTRLSNVARVCAILGAAVWATPNVTAQGEPELGIQTYAGVTILGEIGRVYSIEYVTDPAGSDWRSLEFLQLPASPYLWADKTAPATGKRFYGLGFRVVLAPGP